jgi:hypothetical protein
LRLSDLDLEQLLDPNAYAQKLAIKQNRNAKKTSNEESLMELLKTLGYRS